MNIIDKFENIKDAISGYIVNKERNTLLFIYDEWDYSYPAKKEIMVLKKDVRLSLVSCCNRLLTLQYLCYIW